MKIEEEVVGSKYPGETKVDAREIERELVSLHRVITQIEELVAALEIDLKKIMREENPTECTESDEEPIRTDLGSQIRDKREKLSMVKDVLISIERRLEL